MVLTTRNRFAPRCHNLVVVGLAYDIVGGAGNLCVFVGIAAVQGDLKPVSFRTGTSHRGFGQSRIILLRCAWLAHAKKMVDTRFNIMEVAQQRL